MKEKIKTVLINVVVFIFLGVSLGYLFAVALTTTN